MCINGEFICLFLTLCYLIILFLVPNFCQVVISNKVCGPVLGTNSPTLVLNPLNVSGATTTNGKSFKQCKQNLYPPGNYYSHSFNGIGTNKAWLLLGTGYRQPIFNIQTNVTFGGINDKFKWSAQIVDWPGTTNVFMLLIQLTTTQRERVWYYTSRDTSENPIGLNCEDRNSGEEWSLILNYTDDTQIWLYNQSYSNDTNYRHEKPHTSLRSNYIMIVVKNGSYNWAALFLNTTYITLRKCVYLSKKRNTNQEVMNFPCGGPAEYCSGNYNRTKYENLFKYEGMTNESFCNTTRQTCSTHNPYTSHGHTCPACPTVELKTSTCTSVCASGSVKVTCPTCTCSTQCIFPSTNSGFTSKSVLTTFLTVTMTLLVSSNSTNSNVSNHNYTFEDPQCTFFCTKHFCSGSNHGKCHFWCDGKKDETGMCQHFCYTYFASKSNTSANNSEGSLLNSPYIKCIDLGWTDVDMLLYRVSVFLTLQILAILCGAGGLLFWMYKFKWYNIFPWLFKTCLTCQPRGPIFQKKIRSKRFRSEFRFGNIKIGTTNCCVIILLFILTCGRVRPTSGIVIGPEDFGKAFNNGSLGIQIHTSYDWFNLSRHNDDQVCYKQNIEKQMSVTCCSSKSCSVRGLNSDCTYKSGDGTCAATYVNGGGWPHGCFCIGSNTVAGSCRVWCSKGHSAYVYDLVQMQSNKTFAFSLQHQANKTLFHVNTTGTHQFIVNNHTINVTISGCDRPIVNRIGFVPNVTTPPLDVSGCPRFSKWLLKDDCSLHVWFGYNKGSVQCSAPLTCKYRTYNLYGKRTHHGWEHYLKCDWNFQWHTKPCGLDSTGSLIGCMGKNKCLVVFNNCTTCCYKNNGVVGGYVYTYQCNNCIWNGTKWNGTILDDHYKVDAYVSRSVTNYESAIAWLGELWTSLTNWFNPFGWWKWIMVCLVFFAFFGIIILFCRK